VPWYLPLSRFDTAVLRPPPPPPPWAGAPSVALPAAQQATWDHLSRWCHADAGPGHTAWWQPWSLPNVAQRLKVAVWAGDDEPTLALLDDFCRHIDGSQRLQALPSRWRGHVWRLQIKLHECAWWRGAQDHFPWDAGYLVAGDSALAHLVAFRPRRATLMVAKGLRADQANAVVKHLQTQSSHYAHALRLVVLNSA
jgi:hypothetical protein